MPLDIREFLALADQDDSTPKSRYLTQNGANSANGAPGAPSDTSGGKWGQLFEQHPEGGGPFGGRDNALTVFVGFLRAKSIPYEASRLFALEWNRHYCFPPMGDADVLEKVSRKWVQWQQGGLEDRKPEDFLPGGKPPEDWKFLTLREMADEEQRIGGLEWLLDEVIPVGGLVYFTAPPAGGKTWLMLDLVRCLIEGGRWIGRFDIEPVRSLYIDEEMGVRKILPRFRKLGVNMTAEGFWYTNKAGVRFDQPKDVSKILTHCKENGIRVVIVDTLTRVHRLDENDNSHMKRLFDYFSVLLNEGITVIVAHHNRKSAPGDMNIKHEQTRGAGEIVAAADMCYSVTKQGKYFRFETTKGRLASEEDAVSVDFTIEDNEDKTRVAVRAVDAEERSEKALESLEGAVIDFVQASGTEGANTRTIRESVDGRSETIATVLSRLVQKGVLSATEEGRSKVYRYQSF